MNENSQDRNVSILLAIKIMNLDGFFSQAGSLCYVFVQALIRKTDDELIHAGCIQYFEFAFELAGKTLKFAIIDQGLPDCYSPKSCLKQAFAVGWIEDEKTWLDMLESRNRMSQIYNAQSALDIYNQLPAY